MPTTATDVRVFASLRSRIDKTYYYLFLVCPEQETSQISVHQTSRNSKAKSTIADLYLYIFITAPG